MPVLTLLAAIGRASANEGKPGEKYEKAATEEAMQCGEDFGMPRHALEQQ